MVARGGQIARIEVAPDALDERRERRLLVQRRGHERFHVGTGGTVHARNADEPSERDRADAELDPLPLHLGDRGREADVEAARLHADEQRDAEVTELVEDDEQGQADDDGDPDHATGIARAARSTSTSSSRSRAGAPSARSSASVTSAAMSRNGILLSRNAATAASFAALKTHGYVPPFSPASRASASIGNVSRSGASKMSESVVRSSGARGVAARSGYVSAYEIGARMSG